MDDKEKMESHLSSAAAFVEGGIQDACEDACSICLEAFSDSDPSAMTGCKHEFHLQCILEWCQRSAKCPMCWQPLNLKDPISQELLETVERERSIRLNQSQNTTIFHHPALGDFELHLPVGSTSTELEERIIQHLTSAAAMGRARHISRREGHRRSRAQGHEQFLVFSVQPNASPSDRVFDLDQRGDNPLSANAPADPSNPILTGVEEVMHQVPHVSSSELHASPQSDITSVSRPVQLDNGSPAAAQSTPVSQDRGGPSDYPSFSELLKSRLNAVSIRCKESITKSTREWRERFFSHQNSVADLGCEVRREVQAGIASVSRIIERLDTRETNTTGVPIEHSIGEHSPLEPSNSRISVTQDEDTQNATSPSASRALSGSG